MRILFFIFFFTIYSFLASSETVNDVIINNNKRISKESIISLGSIRFGNDYDQSDLDAVTASIAGTASASEVTALQAQVASPTYDCTIRDQASYLDTSVVLNEERKEVSVFCVNKHPDQALHAEISLENFSELSGLEHICLTGPDHFTKFS